MLAAEQDVLADISRKGSGRARVFVGRRARLTTVASTVIYTEIAPQRFKGFWKD